MENKAKGPIAPAPHASSLLPSLKALQASERTAASFIKCPLTAAESRRRAPRGCRKGAGTFWTSKTRKKKKSDVKQECGVQTSSEQLLSQNSDTKAEWVEITLGAKTETSQPADSRYQKLKKH